MAWPRTPKLTTDCVILDARGRVLLIRRGNPPYKGAYALPGGFVDPGETVEDACRREVAEEVGIAVRKLTLVGVYSDPKRDPRGHSVSTAFLARVANPEPVAGSDAKSAEWTSPKKGMKLAFDHALILADALRLARRRR